MSIPGKTHILFAGARIICATLLLGFTSCEVYNPEEEVPSYIRINKINVSVTDSTYSGQGTYKQDIKDAWIYVDDQPIGAFELPISVPILAGGSHTVKIRSGILQNGIPTARVQYPFLDFYSASVNLTREKITQVDPVTTYYASTKFDWIEDFEQLGVSMEKSNSDTILYRTNIPAEVFQGKQSGVAYLDANKVVFEYRSSTFFPIPKGRDVYLEIHHKSNNKFVIGVYGDASGAAVPVLAIQPSAEWKKTYIDLSGAISNSASSSFKVFIGMVKDANVALPVLYFDNIKLLHK